MRSSCSSWQRARSGWASIRIRADRSLKTGRRGPFVQLGNPEDGAKPRKTWPLKKLSVAEIDFEMALKLLSLPRNLGNDPETGKPGVAYNGLYGAYVKSGEKNRSLPAGISPLDVTLDEALQVLAQACRYCGHLRS